MTSPAKIKTIKGETGDWEIVIGMEVHAQVTSNAKLFSGASTEFGAEPNSQVSFIDAGFPGMLPVINEKCVEQAVRTGLGLKARINLRSIFDRKNYFFPDLPQGYQISQYKDPIVGEGEVTIDLKDGESIKVGIERLHLEQDAGKSLHDQSPDSSFVDLNRSGVALMEIVSKPHMRTSEEAAAFLKKLRAIVRYLGTCDGNMDEGSMRCEIKNVNSMRFVQMAIEHEARRQIEVIEGGGAIVQETRRYDSKANETRSMRAKEDAHDYRYFPDPDLLPLELEQAWVDAIAATLPELPDEKKARFMAQGLSAYDASVLVAERELADFYEDLARGVDAKAAANWLNNEILGRPNRDGLSITQVPVGAAANNAIIQMVSDKTISGKIAKDLLDIVWTEGGDPRQVVEARGLRQVTDTGAIDAAIEAVIAANPDKVEEVKAKPKLAAWFVGQVMKQTGGKANPAAVNAALKTRLNLPDEG